MTISTTDSRADFNGNGVTDTFSFPYRFFMDSDLVVLLVQTTGTVVPQTLDTDYTVNGADTPTSGEVVMVVPPATGERLVVYRDIALTQETDYISGDSFPAETHERALDKLTMIVQAQAEAIGRSFKINIADVSVEAELPAPQAGRFLGWSEDGSALVNLSSTGVGAGGVGTTELQDGSVTTSKLATDAVTTVKIADGVVTSAKLGGAVAIDKGGTGETTAAAAFGALKQNATETATGVVEKLTTAEAQASVDDTRYHSAATMKAAQIQLGTSVTLTNQTAVDFTGIPSWAKRIKIKWFAAKSNNISHFLVRLGDAGGVEETGYVSTSLRSSSAAGSPTNSTTGFIVSKADATFLVSGSMTIEKFDGTNVWISDHNVKLNTAQVASGGGDKTLSDVLTQVRFTTVNGTDVLEAGMVNISWE